MASRLSHQALLVIAFLVTHKGESLSREEVAFTLWPDLGVGEARATLRRHLYKLQQTFGPALGRWLDCDSRTLAWAPGDATWVDVEEFIRSSESEETLEAAATLYRDDFAPHLDHEWAATIREQLRVRARGVFERLAGQRQEQGDVAGAVHYLERLLALDPWREDALRRLLLLRYRSGDRAGALSRYRSFCEDLRAEFDVDPMAETVRCIETVAQGLVPGDG
jgi:DNA-binding SARP family transcriptional activator